MPDRDSLGFTIPGYKAVNGSTTVSIDEKTVGSAYFATMGLTFIRCGIVGSVEVRRPASSSTRRWRSGSGTAAIRSDSH